MRDPEEVLEDHCENKVHFAALAEATEDILDKLEELEGEEANLRADIATDLSLKAELEAKLDGIRARITASEPAIQDLTSRTFRARLASKNMASVHRALSLDMDNLTDL
ncbi:hypothetical protein L3X38_004211 [Prunus dulcis]|uniref:Uncharacterized protein n=1 Tax=Prunus dulcis TaxID=3755 RepID=A0AAD5F318_PRUDU|nr:hypothetical protein L3X38_004211 [Prunus dulcis]